MKKFLSSIAALLMIGSMSAETHTWDFTSWSDATKANLIAELSDQTTGFSDCEKAAQIDEAGVGTPTELSKENCFWNAGDAEINGTVTANGVAVAELEGLDFYVRASRGSFAIAVNYGEHVGTNFGPYHGPSYVWLGHKTCYFTIHNVKAGSTLKMGVESHKNGAAEGETGDARGVQPYVGETALEAFTPTTYEEHEWTIPSAEELGAETTDVKVQATNGCHVYYVTAEVGTESEEPEPQPQEGTAGTATWVVGNENEATLSEEIAEAVLQTSVKVGTDLTVTTYDATSNGGGTMATYQPATGNAGCVETDMIEYTVKMKKGLTFTVSNVVFDAVKQGTDNAYFSWSYVCDGVESEVVAYSNPKEQVLRNDNSNSDVAPLTHDEAISATACREFKLRFYISNVANNKKMSIGNIKINGVAAGEEEVRSFVDFKVDFRTDPYTVLAPEAGLPEGVAITGTFHDGQHGYTGAVVTVPVDGPVKFTVGGCGYSNQATVVDAAGNTLATLDTRGAGCDSSTSFDHYVTWTYNSEEPTTLTLNLGNYCPFLYAEACELIPICTVRYYDVDGKTIVGEEEVEGGSALKYAYGAEHVTVADGEKFRGWFNSTQSSAVKVAEGTSVQENLNLYAKATEIEIPTNTSRYIYELNKVNFYIEDHEAIWTEGGVFHDSQHGWVFGAGNTLSIAVAGKAIISVGNCKYSAEGAEATVTNVAGETVATFPVKVEADGAETTFQYDSEKADTLTITFGGTAYIHKVTVYNVVEFVEFDEASGYYFIPANDANSFLIALASANATGNAKIFLPNGTYDLGELVLTQISGNNISIIGESMDGTILVNAPAIEIEGIGTTATLLNSSDGLYLQDLTIQNALDYYKTGAAGRAVCLQDKGTNTIQKNVKMLSYQDTYYSNRASNRYWEDSEIHGTVDYLCGDGNVFYNRVALVNESRSATANSGSDVIAAPNCTATTADRTNWGYVFLDCTIKSNCTDFTFARSWGGESTCYWINTKVLDNSLNEARWTTKGMNIAAYCFKEYNTTDAEGNVTTPASNVVTFTHNTGDRSFETVLTAEEAAAITVDNVFGDWKPQQYTAQLEAADFTTTGATLEWAPVEGAQGYAIVKDGSIIEILGADATSYEIAEEGTYELRVANLRGGFGVAATPKDAVSIESLEVAPSTTGVAYNLFGQRVSNANGICIIDGKKMMK